MKKTTLSLAVLIASAVSPCALADKYLERAKTIATNAIIIDTHIDVPYRINAHWDDVSQATEKGDFDYPRAIAGGLNAPFMSIYIPAKKESQGGAKALADALIDQVEAIVYRAPDKFAIARTSDDIESHFKEGKISLPLGIENGAAIEGDIANVKHFYERGVRYITLTHSKANHISDSSYDDNRLWQGLSPFGFRLIEEMNKVGIMVDVSHVSDKAFFEAVKASKVPVIASHSSARHFTPGFERNMSDEMIKTMAQHDGVIMINFGSSFLTKEALDYGKLYWDAVEAFQSEHKLADGSPKLDAFKTAYREKMPYPYADVNDVADHIDHVVKLVGIESVGIGSDYDGVGDTLPTGLKDVSTYPNLIAELLRRGYKEADIKLLLGGNVLRVMKAVETYAAKH